MRYLKLFNSRYAGKIRKEKWFRMVCPFHDDASPSLDVDIDKGGYHCWGCNAKGNIIRLIMKLERVSDSTARNIISNYMSKIITSGKLGEKEEKLFYLDSILLEQFVPISDPSFLQYMKKRKIPLELAKKYNLRQGNPIHRGWENRVIYPIYDIYGNLCSIEGRTIDEDKMRYRKWTGSRSGLGIFGINMLLEQNWGNPIIIVEGMFDALSIISIGFNSLALSCSEITTKQMIQLRKVTNFPIIIFDGHKNGTEKERKRVEEKVRVDISKKFINYKIETIPFVDTDPNDLLRQGKLRKYIQGVYKNETDKHGKKITR